MSERPWQNTELYHYRFCLTGAVGSECFEERKQLYVVQQEKEKQQAIQQSTEKKKPPMPPQVQLPLAAAAMLPQEVVQPWRIADIMMTKQVISDFKWKDRTVNILKQAIPAEMATWSEEKREQIENNKRLPTLLLSWSTSSRNYHLRILTEQNWEEVKGESNGTKRLSLAA